MSRLYRGLWFVEARHRDGSVSVTQPAEYEVAEVTAPLLDDVRSAILRRVPASRAPWERKACFEASDPPRWGDEGL